MLFLPLVIASGALFPGCGDMTRAVTFRVIPDPESWAVGDQPGYLVVTQKNWPTYYSSPPMGANFVAYIYLVASRGVKPNPGYGIKILGVEQLKNKITVKLELREPDPKKVYPQIIVCPIAVAEIAKVKLEPYDLLSFTFVDQKGNKLASVER